MNAVRKEKSRELTLQIFNLSAVLVPLMIQRFHQPFQFLDRLKKDIFYFLTRTFHQFSIFSFFVCFFPPFFVFFVLGGGVEVINTLHDCLKCYSIQKKIHYDAHTHTQFSLIKNIHNSKLSSETLFYSQL